MMLGFVLVELEGILGIPANTLYILALFPVVFLIYDIYCYKTKSISVSPYLKCIAIANLLYCILSIGFTFYHYNVVTISGWAYIILEVFILVILAIIEIKVSNRIDNSH